MGSTAYQAIGRSGSKASHEGGCKSCAAGLLLGFVAIMCLIEANTPRKMKQGLTVGLMANLVLSLHKVQGRSAGGADFED